MQAQSIKNHKNNNRQNKNNTDKHTTSWYGLPFWEKPGWRFKYCWTCRSGFHEGKTCKSKKEVHKDEATYAQRVGGYIKRFKRQH